MNSQANSLPTRFPVGTKLVIESRPARDGQQVFSRHLEFPNGTFFPLPSRAPRKPISVTRRRSQRR